MSRAARVSFLAACIIPAFAWAQAQTIPADLSATLAQLAAPDTHDLAEAHLKTMPESAIVPLWDYWADSANTDALRNDVALALREIYPHARDDRAAQAKHAEAWWDATSTAIYMKSAHDSQLDPLVIQAFREGNAGRPTALNSLKAALDAGSTDPLLLQFYIVRDPKKSGATPSLADLLELQKNIADIEKSPYPAGRKLLANLHFLNRAKSPFTPPQITRDQKLAAIDRVVALFPAFLAENPPPYLPKAILADLYADSRDIFALYGPDARKNGFDRIGPPLAKALPDNPRVRALEAAFYVDYAWDARGNDFANTVSDKNWQLFYDRLDRAAAAADKAWRLDPLDPDSAALMITVAMGKGLDHDIMEMWFSRAIHADPHNLDACTRKMNYLLPKWNGSEEEVLAFGRWCVAQGNGYDRLPTVLLLAHQDLRRFSDGFDAYMAQPQVWADHQAVYEKLLADRSRLKSDRSGYIGDRARYLFAARNCQQWKAILRLMDEFGEDVDLTPFGGKAGYDDLRRQAAAKADK